MKATVTTNNVHIEDSAEVSKRYFGEILCDLIERYPESNVFWYRSIWSLKMEWSAHNFLYRLHIARSHTKDVDLNYPQKWWEKIFYEITGIIGWIFIN